jgi:hypothetical protein
MEQIQLQQINQKNTEAKDLEFGKRHEWKRLSLILITYVFFILALGFNFLQSLFWTPKSDLFPSTTGDISDKFFTDITPAGTPNTLNFIFFKIFLLNIVRLDFLYLGLHIYVASKKRSKYYNF